MKSLVDLLALLLRDCGGQCGVDVTLDVKTLRARVKDEGDSFITITLAEYGKSLDQALAAGRVVPGLFVSFGKLKSGIPSFGKGFLHHVFDSKSGVLLPTPSVQAIRALRQISRFGAKVNLPCSPARERAALRVYEEVDQTCRDLADRGLDHRRDDGDPRPSPVWDSRLGYLYKAVASTLVGAMALEDEDGNVPVRCAHGPGATVEGYTPNGKWNLGYWHSRLEEAGLTLQRARFGAEKSLWGSERVRVQPVYVDPGDERPAKVVLVPKTLKSPRVIAVEPAAMQLTQQGLKAVLVPAIDHCRYTSGRINFRDQKVNQEMALRGSRGENIATIDLKDASDRVGVDLVDAMFRAAPLAFRRLLWASRSTRALLPDGRVLTLRKFASMGSALCFPVESLIFYGIVLAARLEHQGLPPTSENIQKVSSGVYVYGDDLCVPADETPTICVALEAFGLRVNRHKTFCTGKFRESCGVDAYDGENVTPTYLRRMPPADRADASGICSTVATANLLAKAGYWRTALALQECVHRVFGLLPEVPEQSPALGWTFFSKYVPPARRNRRLQRLEHRCWVPYPVMQRDPLTDEDAVWAKCCRRIGLGWLPNSAPFAEVVRAVDSHLDESARPYALTLKRRWVAL